MNYPFNDIIDHYKSLLPEIIKRSQINIRSWVNPYSEIINWNKLFTPIENNTWQAIRLFGHAPLYPQFPVGKYFIDFANPYLKIGLECDGHDFHLDKDKDDNRDNELYKMGWKIYRIPGKDCVRPVSNDFYELTFLNHQRVADVIGEYYHSTIEGLINAIGIIHFNYETVFKDGVVDERMIAESCIKERASIL